MALYSNVTSSIRQSISRILDDIILATVSSGTTTTAVLATTDPPQFRNKANDYFNNLEYEVYTYAGINIGESAVASDWTIADHTLTVDRTLSAFTTASKLELHKIFTSQELLNAINLAIDSDAAKKCLLDIKDDTTVVMAETTSNDSNTLYTYEYNLPTNMLYVHRVTLERAVSGKKLTGTVSGAFTLGETITGGTSGATGILSYGPSGATYILVREVDGTFEEAETATGTTSSETCSTITAVENKLAGDGTFPYSNELDPRDYEIINAYTPEIQFQKEYVTVTDGLRVRIEGQGSQARVTSDTSVIYLEPEWLCWKAITLLPFSKIDSNNLGTTFKVAEAKAMKIPKSYPKVNSKAVIE